MEKNTKNVQDVQKLTKKETFLNCLKNKLCHISKACEAANIGRQTYYSWIEKDDKFKEQVEAAKEGLIDHVEHQLLRRINHDDTTAIIFSLKTRAKDRGYVEKQEITLSKPIEDITFDEI